MVGRPHLLSYELQDNRVTGKLTGEGRIRVRLNQEETYEDARRAMQKSGLSVREVTS